jgi:hypothetical protein
MSQTRRHRPFPVQQCPGLLSDSQPDTLISKGAGKEGGFRHAREILWSVDIERFRGHGFDVYDLGFEHLKEAESEAELAFNLHREIPENKKAAICVIHIFQSMKR